MINWIDILGALIALAALIFSFVNNSRVKRLEDNQIKLSEIELREKQEEQDMKTKAICDVNIIKVGQGRYILKLFNKGKGTAKKVDLVFLSQNKLDIQMDARNPIFPIDELEPQKNIDFYIFAFDGMTGPWKYRLSWLNEDGKKNDKEGNLTMPMM